MNVKRLLTIKPRCPETFYAAWHMSVVEDICTLDIRAHHTGKGEPAIKTLMPGVA